MVTFKDLFWSLSSDVCSQRSLSPLYLFLSKTLHLVQTLRGFEVGGDPQSMSPSTMRLRNAFASPVPPVPKMQSAPLSGCLREISFLYLRHLRRWKPERQGASSLRIQTEDTIRQRRKHFSWGIAQSLGELHLYLFLVAKQVLMGSWWIYFQSMPSSCQVSS